MKYFLSTGFDILVGRHTPGTARMKQQLSEILIIIAEIFWMFIAVLFGMCALLDKYFHFSPEQMFEVLNKNVYGAIIIACGLGIFRYCLSMLGGDDED